MSARPLTLAQKVWDRHVVTANPGEPELLYIDLHLVHEVTSPQAFGMLRDLKLKVAMPHRTFATVDHIVPLACGGSDSPSNMQWQTKAAAAAKDKVERRGC